MIFGKQISRLILCSLVCSGLFMHGAPAFSHACENRGNTEKPIQLNEDTVGLDEVLTSLRRSSEHEQPFHEIYYSGMLTTPSHKEGTLVFHPPTRLEKHIRVPTEESFIINGSNLLYENPAREISQTFSLEEYPALATLIEGLRALFNGDKDTLQQFFDTSVVGTQEVWTLTLSPIIQNEENGVECIRLAGKQAYLQTISIQETNGDHSELQLDPQVP